MRQELGNVLIRQTFEFWQQLVAERQFLGPALRIVVQSAAEQHASRLIDQHHTVMRAAVIRHQEGFQQLRAFDLFLFCQRDLDLARRRQDQRHIVLAENLRRTGQVHNADHVLGEGIEDRRTGAGPGLYAFGKMLGGMHVRGFAGFKRRADAIGADGALAPVAAKFQVDFLALVQHVFVTDGVDDHPLAIRQDQDGAGLFKMRLQPLEGRRGRLAERSIAFTSEKQLTFVDHLARSLAAGIDPQLPAAPPGIEDLVPHLRRHPVALFVSEETNLSQALRVSSSE